MAAVVLSCCGYIALDILYRIVWHTFFVCLHDCGSGLNGGVRNTMSHDLNILRPSYSKAVKVISEYVLLYSHNRS